MASQSLYRKWRSQTFSDLVGQEAVVRTLLNAVRDGRLAHAYLFCGPRGTGKTSAARLLAKAVNCANPHNGEPCNECDSCREIAAGRSPDVIEIDAASNTGVDNIRELRENVNLLGSGGRHKIYIVDEVHMLSTAAFNALLKTLEEPPPHVIFVLATTEAHKVLQTVVSRCQRFDFRRIGMRDIVARIRHVAEGEGLTLEPGVAELLGRAAQGGLRDALSLLDQAMAYCGTEIDLERTRRMLGLADPTLLRALIEHVAEQRAAEGLHLIHQLVVSGADLRQITQQLAEEWRALLLARAGADVAQLMERTDEEANDLRALAGRFSLEELMACARVFARNDTPARGMPVPQLALELAFLECASIRAQGGAIAVPQMAALPMAAPAPVVPTPVAPRPSAPPIDIPRSVPQPVTPAAMPSVASVASAAPASSSPTFEELDLDAIERDEAPPVAVRPTIVPPAMPDEPDYIDDEPDFEPVIDVPAAFVVPPAPTPAPVAEVMESASVPAQQGQDLTSYVLQNWAVVKKVCRQKSAQVAALLNSVQPVVVEDGNPPVLVLHATAAFHLEKLREPAKREAVEWSLAQVLEMPMRVRLALAGKDSGGAKAPRGSAPTPISSAAAPVSLPATNGLHSASNGHSPAAPSPAPERPPRPTESQNSAISNASAAPTRPSASATPSAPTAPTAPTAPAQRVASGNGNKGLEDEARTDPVVREILRTLRVELDEVRPLDED